MIRYGNMWGLIQGPTQTMVRTLVTNLWTYEQFNIEYKEQFMVNGIMHNVIIHSLTSKCCQLITTFPSCEVSLHLLRLN